MAKDMGVTAAAIGNFRAGKSNPSFDFVEKLLICYPMINANWLIVNKGEMLTDPKVKINDKLQRVGGFSKRDHCPTGRKHSNER
jgi:transcriptional regulator with XRE-family HTH domain